MKDLPSMNALAASPAIPDRQLLSTPVELRPSAQAFLDEVLLLPLIPIGRNGLRGTPVRRSPGALRLHPAFNDLNLSGWLLNSELREKPQDIHEPILITLHKTSIKVICSRCLRTPNKISRVFDFPGD